MASLSSTKIYRGGKTANHLNFESKKCSFHVNPKDKSLDLRFELKSKGGGTTEVLLEIGEDDFPALLKAIAQKMPETVGILSECAAIANNKVVALLKNARSVQADEKSRARDLMERLEDVEEFISDKYNEAPAGKDEREAKILDQIDEVVRLLREQAGQ
ncbi:hypothetical protein [Allochromatium vinosum]|uniref:hypothetical protein n=1 Tax=Allochromatium vinosum TaxID=1049 RepID=UPI001904806B|nr:hypothetical protein [Allochromatium vinosum]